MCGLRFAPLKLLFLMQDRPQIKQSTTTTMNDESILTCARLLAMAGMSTVKILSGMAEDVKDMKQDLEAMKVKVN